MSYTIAPNILTFGGYAGQAEIGGIFACFETDSPESATAPATDATPLRPPDL